MSIECQSLTAEALEFFFRLGLQPMYVIITPFTLMEQNRLSPGIHLAHTDTKKKGNRSQMRLKSGIFMNDMDND